MDSLRKQIYDNLNLRETEDLLEIWQEQDTDEWQSEVFEIIEQILTQRLGYAPSREFENLAPHIPKPSKSQDEVETAIQHAEQQAAVNQILRQASHNVQVRNLGQALKDCEAAVELAPDLADAYILRGQVYEELGQPKKALVDYAEALRLDPESDAARVYLVAVEEDLDEKFQGSPSKRDLDRAAEFALDGEPEKALEEIEFARRDLPGIAPAYTYLGTILAELGRWEQAAEALQEAIRFNPRYYEAREKLAAVYVQLEAEQYRQAVVQNEGGAEVAESFSEDEAAEVGDLEAVESEDISDEGEPVPGWVYLGEKEFHLAGWPGHRTRPGRSGYDPLETDFERAHVMGILIRKLFTLKLRTSNPIYLLLMIFFGLVACMPLVFILGSLQPGIDLGNLLITLVFISPFLVFGLALLLNVILSLFASWPDDYDENGGAFF